MAYEFNIVSDLLNLSILFDLYDDLKNRLLREDIFSINQHGKTQSAAMHGPMVMFSGT